MGRKKIAEVAVAVYTYSFSATAVTHAAAAEGGKPCPHPCSVFKDSVEKKGQGGLSTPFARLDQLDFLYGRRGKGSPKV